MAKRRATLEITLPPRCDGETAYRWLYDGLRVMILDGSLGAGMRVPASRDVAAQYGLSRGTVVAAYEQLIAEGFLEARTGAGTFVAGSLLRSQERRAQCAGARDWHLSRFGRGLSAFPTFDLVPSRPFRPNIPALDLFPTALWSKLLNRRLRSSDPYLLMGCDATGYQPLRVAVADYRKSSRGVRCTADNVLIVSGTQEALDITARVFLDAGDRVCRESPGYEGALKVFEAAGVDLRSGQVDDQGLVVDSDALADAKLVYITPAHQFPLGVTMSIARRLSLLEWAKRSEAIIFEDDYDSEFRYRGKPVQSLQGLDDGSSVIFSGTFSKTLFPSLRLGYMVVPDSLVERFSAAKSVTNRHAPLLEQTALCDFITDGHFARHVQRMRTIYAERLSTLQQEAKRQLGGFVSISPIETGLQTVGQLCSGHDAEAIASRGRDHGLDLRPIALSGARCDAFLLGFAAFTPRSIAEAITRIARLVTAGRSLSRPRAR